MPENWHLARILSSKKTTPGTGLLANRYSKGKVVKREPPQLIIVVTISQTDQVSKIWILLQELDHAVSQLSLVLHQRLSLVQGDQHLAQELAVLDLQGQRKPVDDTAQDLQQFRHTVELLCLVDESGVEGGREGGMGWEGGMGGMGGREGGREGREGGRRGREGGEGGREGGREGGGGMGGMGWEGWEGEREGVGREGGREGGGREGEMRRGSGRKELGEGRGDGGCE